MTLKRRISINIAAAFSILFGLAATIIYYSFSSFRKEEFRGRLEEKALTTAKLLLEVKEVDNQLLKLIDKNTINKLYNEKTLVFDERFNLIYSSIDDATIDWNLDDLKFLKKEKTFYKADSGKDLLGIFYDFEKTDYYVLIAAEDKYGNSKLEFLLFSLVVTFLAGTLLVWLSTYFFIEKLLEPLDTFQQQITNISANQLNVQLKEFHTNDEINLLTKAFNQMLLRIETAFNTQKEFAANASHELRTPLTRIAFQTENLLQDPTISERTQQYLKSIYTDIHQLSDLIDSLLLLTKLGKDDLRDKFSSERIDEIIFSANKHVKANEPEFELDFEIVDNPQFETTLEVKGIKSLLEIAFTNLLKNAFLYSIDKKAYISIEQISEKSQKVIIRNRGTIISEKERTKLFSSFFRGANASQIYGSGLGLKITKRILDYHNATIYYRPIDPDWNEFIIEL